MKEKFEKRQQDFIMILGGANEEDARNFSMEAFKESLRKKVPEYNEQDSKNLRLARNYSQGMKIYNKLPSGKPLYCRVLDNLDYPDKIPVKTAKGDQVYDALVELYSRIEEIHKEQFMPFEHDPNRDERLQEHEYSGLYELGLDSKQQFVNGMIRYFNNRGPVKGDKFLGYTSITEERYNFLKEFLVDSDLETKLKFEKEFISHIPMYEHEGFYFWPEE